MPPNVKIKVIKTPSASRRQSKPRRSPTPDLSDSDGGYSALDEVSEDDEEDVEAAEEAHLVTISVPRPPEQSSSNYIDNNNNDDDENDGDEDEEGGGGIVHQANGHRGERESVDDTESTAEDADAEDADAEDADEPEEEGSWNGFLSEAEELCDEPEAKPAIERRVHFADDVPSPSSGSDSTETEIGADMFPDIFVSETSLDPRFRREMHREQDEPSSDDSYWDFSAAYIQPPHEVMMTAASGSEDSASDSASGAHDQQMLNNIFSHAAVEDEEDESDASSDRTDTDNEAPMLRSMLKKSGFIHGSSTESDTTDAEAFVKRNGEPRARKVDLDKIGNRAVSFFDPEKKAVISLTPKDMEIMDQLDLSTPFFLLAEGWNSNNLLSSPGGNSGIRGDSMLDGLDLDVSFGMDILTSPMGGQGQDGARDPFPDLNLSPDEIMACLEDFPSVGVDAGEELIDHDAFFSWPAENGEVTDFEGCEDDATPARPVTATSEMEAETPMMLSHLQNDSRAVGAFRRNQHTQNLIHSERVTEEALEFSGLYTDGPIRGIRTGKLESALVPISPIRRQKRPSVDIGSSPLAHKRRAPSEAEGQAHKRQRSISDIGNNIDFNL